MNEATSRLQLAHPTAVLDDFPVDHLGLHGKVDVQVGTLSKAIGALGGYVCGSKASRALPHIGEAGLDLRVFLQVVGLLG